MYSFRKPLTDELFQVPPKVLTMDGAVSLVVMKGAILFYPRERGVILDRSRMPDSRLLLDGIEDLIDGEPERGEVLCQFEGLEQTH